MNKDLRQWLSKENLKETVNINSIENPGTKIKIGRYLTKNPLKYNLIIIILKRL